MLQSLPAVVRTTLAVLVGMQFGVGYASAQAAPDRPVPQLSLSGTSNVRALAQWPGVSLTVDRDAFVAVFAVTRGRREFPLQILAPQNPSAKGFVKAGERLRVRQLAKDEMLHLVNWGEAPVIVAFASTVRPDLSAYVGGRNQWGRDLLLDTAATTQQELVDVLGKSIFGRDAQYDVVVSTASTPTPLSRYADVWAFDNSCLGEASRWTRFSGYAGYGLYGWMDLDPIVRVAMGSGSIFMPWGWSSGLPITLFSGVGQVSSQYSIEPVTYGGCREYRVAWWPQMVYPTDQRPRWPMDSTSAAGPEALPSPLPRAPRYPAAGTGLQVDPRSVARDGDMENPVYRSPTFPGDDRSAWRRGETPSAQRFPAVMADERPWSRPSVAEARPYVPPDAPPSTLGRNDREVNRTTGSEPRREVGNSGQTVTDERLRQPASSPTPSTPPPVERDVKPSFPSGGPAPVPSAPPPPPPPSTPPPSVPPPSGGPGGPIIPPLAP